MESELKVVSPNMLEAYVSWEPPCQLDVSSPPRALGLIRAAFFAGWNARAPGPGAEPVAWLYQLEDEEQISYHRLTPGQFPYATETPLYAADPAERTRGFIEGLDAAAAVAGLRVTGKVPLADMEANMLVKAILALSPTKAKP